MVRALAPVLSAGLSLLLVQCSTGGSAAGLQRVLEIRPGDQVRVVHADRQAKLTIGLQNAAFGSRQQVYSQGGDAALKVADDEQLQVLLDILAEQGFFQQALANEKPAARSVLAVEHNGRTWVWSRLPLGQDDAESIQRFYRCVGYVQELYNRTTAYYTREGMTAEDFEREKQAIEGRAQKTIENLKTRKNPPQ